MNSKPYLLKVRDVLSSHSEQDKELTAAHAGSLVHQHVGSFKDHGYKKFKDVLEELESRGHLSLTITEKGALCIRIKTRVPRLAPDKWRAFVHVEPPGDRYLNVNTGEVLLEMSDAPDGEGWKRIDLIDIEAEKSLARDFADESGAKVDVDKVEWPQGFAAALSQSQLKAWSRLRTEMVVNHAEDWARRNGVDSNVLFRKAKKGLSTAPTSSMGKREIILEAIRRMSDSELLEIKIKAKYLLDVVAD